MSIFGILSLCFLLAILFYFRKIISPKTIMLSLTILITFQLFFVFRDAFVLFSLGNLNSTLIMLFFLAVVIILSIIVNRLLKLKLYKANITIVIVSLLLLLYTEYFNGAFSFKSISEFQGYNLPLKKYYYLIPYKLMKGKVINYEGQASVYYLNFFSPTDIKRDNQGNLFYYKPRGFGKSGYWFQFGIPEGQQV